VTTHIYAVSDLSGNIRNWWSSGTRGNLDPYAYEAYGLEWITPAPEPPITYNVPFFYEGDVGYYQDPTTGLYYVKARWYDPVTGRFISEDPIGPDGGDWNHYGYVRNEPINGIDPTGETCCGPDVTSPVKTILQKTINQFWGWSDSLKQTQCHELTTFPAGWIAWDIIELHSWADADGTSYDHHGDYPGCASGDPCGRTLSINGGCWNAGSINYVTFGVMMRICYDWASTHKKFANPSDYGYSQVVHLVDEYKWYTRGRNWAPALAWAKSGWKYYSAANSPSSPDRGTCSPGCKKWTSGPMHVHWIPFILS
jgi:RHS repeat-associated protein